MVEKVCFGYCDSSAIYYGATSCVSACPPGYYVAILTCTACSSQCITCNNTASYCILCAGGSFSYEGGCVTRCPDGYLPSQQLACVSCGTTCNTTNQLTYTTEVVYVDGKYVVKVKFN